MFIYNSFRLIILYNIILTIYYSCVAFNTIVVYFRNIINMYYTLFLFITRYYTCIFTFVFVTIVLLFYYIIIYCYYNAVYRYPWLLFKDHSIIIVSILRCSGLMFLFGCAVSFSNDLISNM